MKSVLRNLLAVLALSSALLVAQDTASITGTVTDQTGASIPNAQVSVTSTERGETRATTTNNTGDYLFSALPVGRYNVSVSAKGFKKYQANGVDVYSAGTPGISVSGMRRCGAGSRRFCAAP